MKTKIYPVIAGLALLFFSFVPAYTQAQAETTIDISPKGNGIKAGSAGDGWSYGEVEIPDYGTTTGLTLTQGSFTLTGTNDKCMINIKSGVTKVTLQDMTMTAPKEYPGILMEHNYDMEFVIKGQNVIHTSQDDTHAFSACALYTTNNCAYRFTGNGIVGFMAPDAIGIYDGQITIDGPEVDVYGGKQGIRTSDRFEMKSGKLYIQTPTSASNSSAVHSYGITAACGVIISGGYTNISSGYCSVQSDAYVEITGGTNEFTVDTRKEEGFPGIEASQHVDITGGTTTIRTPAEKAVDCPTVNITQSSLQTEQYDASPTGTAPTVSLPAPSNLKLKCKNVQTCKLKWKKVPDAKYYDVYRSSSPEGPFVFLAKADTTSYKDQNLTPGQIYYYQVRSCYSYDNKSELCAAKKIKMRPAKPKKVKVKKKGNKLLIRWKKTKKVTGYKIYISTKAKGKYKCIKTINNAKKKSFTKKGIKRGKTYYVKVRSIFRSTPSSKAIKSKFSKVAHS